MFPSIAKHAAIQLFYKTNVIPDGVPPSPQVGRGLLLEYLISLDYLFPQKVNTRTWQV